MEGGWNPAIHIVQCLFYSKLIVLVKNAEQQIIVDKLKLRLTSIHFPSKLIYLYLSVDD